MRLGLYPNLGVAWYWACLVGEGRPLVTVIDHEVPLPKAPSLEIRADGLWADHTVETPFEHMTLGCEAFAVGVDDPAEVYGDLRGDRVPFGLDLEWETDRGGVYPWIGHNSLRGVVQRARRDPRGRRDDRLRRHRPARPQLGGPRLVDRRLGVDGRLARGRHPVPHHPGARARARGVRAGLRDATRGSGRADRRLHRGGGARRRRLPHRQPTSCAASSTWRSSPSPSRRCTWSTTTAPAPKVARFPRALCRFETTDGRRGVGWTEWNQPERSR